VNENEEEEATEKYEKESGTDEVEEKASEAEEAVNNEDEEVAKHHQANLSGEEVNGIEEEVSSSCDLREHCIKITPDMLHSIISLQLA
jgi:hypothetical protein